MEFAETRGDLVMRRSSRCAGRSSPRSTFVAAALLFCACLSGLFDPAPLGATPPSAGPVPPTFLADPLLYFFDARSSEALLFGEAALRDPATPETIRKNVLITLGTIYLAQ